MNIILPKSNKSDITELKDYIKEDMKFYFVENYKEVYEILFN